jgi:cytochrome d ubiquinol oxidase subunit II
LSFVASGFWLAFGQDGYLITSSIDPNASVSPLAKTVTKSNGLWLNNYSVYPALMLAPLMALVGVLLTIFCSLKHYVGTVFIISSLVVVSALMTAGGSMFPFILPSSIHPASSLTVWDASASRYTLHLLFFATVVFMPIVMAYTTWVYRVMRGKVTVEDIQNNQHIMY